MEIKRSKSGNKLLTRDLSVITRIADDEAGLDRSLQRVLDHLTPPELIAVLQDKINALEAYEP